MAIESNNKKTMLRETEKVIQHMAEIITSTKRPSDSRLSAFTKLLNAYNWLLYGNSMSAPPTSAKLLESLPDDWDYFQHGDPNFYQSIVDGTYGNNSAKR